jgi:hypothetical protein
LRQPGTKDQIASEEVSPSPATRQDKETVVRDNSVRLQSLTDTRGKPSAYPLYIHCRLTGTARNRWTRASGIDKLGAEMDQRVLPPARRLAVGNRQSRPYCRQKLGDAIKAQCPLSFSRPSRGDPLPPVFVMEAAIVHHPLCQDEALHWLADNAVCSSQIRVGQARLTGEGFVLL